MERSGIIRRGIVLVYELWISLCCIGYSWPNKNEKKVKKFSYSLPMIINLLIKNCIPPHTYACFYILRYTLLS